MVSSNNRTSLKIPDDLMQKIKEKAEKENRTVHNTILTILKQHFEASSKDS